MNKRRLSAFSIVIIFSVLSFVGLFMMPLLPVKLFPEHPLSSLSISCRLPGSTPEATELHVTSHLENVVSGIRGVKNVRSVSAAGYANVTVTLDKWTDPALFRLEVSSLLRRIYPALPPAASYPEISVSTSGDENNNGFLIYSLNSNEDPQEITRYAEQHIQPLLATIKGIDRIDVSGAPPLYWELSCNNRTMQQLHISSNDISKALDPVLARADAGMTSNTLHIIRNESGMDTSRLLQLPVKKTGNRLIRLADIAQLQKTQRAAETYYRINGRNVISVAVSAAPGANILVLKDKINQALAGLQIPYSMELIYDATVYLHEELNNLYLRTGLSVFILLLFVWLVTRNLRHLLIVIISMLVNILISFIGYYIFHLEIHLYSLAGIAISLGLTIDNSIIIIEDMELRKNSRVFFTILASTITAVIALSVIFFLEEKQQLNLLDFANAILINLVISLPVAFFFIPALFELMMPAHIKKPAPGLRYVVRIMLYYGYALKWMIRYRGWIIGCFILLFGFPLFLLPEKVDPGKRWTIWYNELIGSEQYGQIRPYTDKYLGGTLGLFLNTVLYKVPATAVSGGRSKLEINIMMPAGSSLEQINELSLEFENYMAQFHEIALYRSTVEDRQHASISLFFKPHVAAYFPPYLKQLLEDKAMASGAADFRISGVGNLFENMTGASQQTGDFIVRGYNYQQLYNFAAHLKDSLLRIPRVDDIFISPFRGESQQSAYEYDLQIKDKQLMRLLGVSESGLAAAFNNNNEHFYHISDLQQLPLVLHTNKAWTLPVWELMQGPSVLNDSLSVRIGGIAGISREKISQMIMKDNHSFVLNVSYKFTGTFAQNKIMQQEMVKRMRTNMPYGYQISDANEYYNTAETNDLRYIMLILLFILAIYLVCGVLLESLTKPLAVILMIPFSFIGVFLTFYWLDSAFGDGGYASLLMLCGIVTNAALYVINDMQQLKKLQPGLSDLKIFLKAFIHKAVPIFITTVSAILSMLPFILNGSEKGFWFTLSVGMIGGLFFSFAGTCLLLPLCLRLKSKV